MTLLASRKVTGVQRAEWQAGVPIASAPLTMRHVACSNQNLPAARPRAINAELIAAQDKPMDTGGYYLPDPAKASAAMRPSATLNAAL
jgi:Monomeric isocitrate dehydrogenase